MKKILILLIVFSAITTCVQASSFSDLEGERCKAAVESLEYIGIVNGINVKEYAPQKSVTRAELSKMVVSAIKENASSTKIFKDVQGHWGESFIVQAAGLGILNGYTDGTFKPDKEVSYAEAITILVRCLGYTQIKNGTEKWYDNYLNKMKEIALDRNVEEFQPEESANRGDIAILLWNTILFKGSGSSLLQKNYSQFSYLENEKITGINAKNGKIMYHTSVADFYVEDGIDFSNLGGMASGFYDKQNEKMIGLEIDAQKGLKRIAGNAKQIKNMGYDTFDVTNIEGYGNKEKANYIEIFVNGKNQVERTVFYDTRESHFAEKIKIGKEKITIESKDLFDHSVIMDNGNMFTINILRTESVKDIDSNAILVHDGKVVPWTQVPNDSVIREIKKNEIYTYIHDYKDVSIKAGAITEKEINLNGKNYVFSEDCIAENVVTDTAVKLSKTLSVIDLRKIVQEDDTIRVYFNEFDEIVKLEFSYDIWKVQEDEKAEKENHDLQPELKRVGIISDIFYSHNTNKDEDVRYDARIISLPGKSSYTFKNVGTDFKIGDWVYQGSGDKKLHIISSNSSVGNLKMVYNYAGIVENQKLGVYSFNEETQWIEVLLQKSHKDENKYSSCSMRNITTEELQNSTRYRRIHLVLNKDNVIIRGYAIREMGNVVNVGIVKELETQKSGDQIVSQKITLTNERKGGNKYNIVLTDFFTEGDMVTFEIKANSEKAGIDYAEIGEVYAHELIGNEKDLVVEKKENDKVYFSNSNEVMDLKSDMFVLNGREYYFDDYVFINAQVDKSKQTQEWIFKYFTYQTKKSVIIKPEYRIAVDELTRTIVIYSGYSK